MQYRASQKPEYKRIGEGEYKIIFPAGYEGIDVHALSNGKVIEIERDEAYSSRVIKMVVRKGDGRRGDDIYTYTNFLNKKLRPGSRIKEGEVLGMCCPASSNSEPLFSYTIKREPYPLGEKELQRLGFVAAAPDVSRLSRIRQGMQTAYGAFMGSGALAAASATQTISYSEITPDRMFTFEGENVGTLLPATAPDRTIIPNQYTTINGNLVVIAGRNMQFYSTGVTTPEGAAPALIVTNCPDNFLNGELLTGGMSINARVAGITDQTLVPVLGPLPIDQSQTTLFYQMPGSTGVTAVTIRSSRVDETHVRNEQVVVSYVNPDTPEGIPSIVQYPVTTPRYPYLESRPQPAISFNESDGSLVLIEGRRNPDGTDALYSTKYFNPESRREFITQNVSGISPDVGIAGLSDGRPVFQLFGDEDNSDLIAIGSNGEIGARLPELPLEFRPCIGRYFIINPDGRAFLGERDIIFGIVKYIKNYSNSTNILPQDGTEMPFTCDFRDRFAYFNLCQGECVSLDVPVPYAPLAYPAGYEHMIPRMVVRGKINADNLRLLVRSSSDEENFPSNVTVRYLSQQELSEIADPAFPVYIPMISIGGRINIFCLNNTVAELEAVVPQVMGYIPTGRSRSAPFGITTTNVTFPYPEYTLPLIGEHGDSSCLEPEATPFPSSTSSALPTLPYSHTSSSSRTFSALPTSPYSQTSSSIPTVGHFANHGGMSSEEIAAVAVAAVVGSGIIMRGVVKLIRMGQRLVSANNREIELTTAAVVPGNITNDAEQAAAGVGVAARETSIIPSTEFSPLSKAIVKEIDEEEISK